ncbi:MAG: nuclease [Deltaproteobacteria bacterium]|nr:nuclease [Deltaproteobacteria bacterium]
MTIDGSLVEVRWSDGDSLRFLSGRLRGEKARLMGYNTLESYGPVHKWGEWSEWELYKISKGAREVAERKAWVCDVGEERDHYGRYLMRCPELTETMLREGVGHLFEVSGDPTPALLQLQLDAMKEMRGMWRKGAPEGLVTSVHSAAEMKDGEPAYNRVATLKTGRANKLFHQDTYEECRWVCAQGSCMLYVPFERRYGDKRPACLRWQGR